MPGVQEGGLVPISVSFWPLPASASERLYLDRIAEINDVSEIADACVRAGPEAA